MHPSRRHGFRRSVWRTPTSSQLPSMKLTTFWQHPSAKFCRPPLDLTHASNKVKARSSKIRHLSDWMRRPFAFTLHKWKHRRSERNAMKTASTSLQLSNLNLPSTRSIFFVVDISECVFIRVRHFSVRIVLRVFWHTGMMVVWSMLLSILMKRSLSSASPCHHACVFSLPVVSPYLSLIPIGRFQPTSSLVVWWLARSTLSLLYGMPSNWNAVDLWHSFGIVLWIQLTWIFLSFSILGIDRVYSFEIITHLQAMTW